MRIYKHEDSGKWGYDIHIDGKRKRSVKFKTKAEARAAAQKFLSKGLADEERILNENTMFVAYYRNWSKINIENSGMNKNSKQLYANAMNKFVEFLKEKYNVEDIKINDITKSMFQEFLNWYTTGRTYESVRKIQNQMKRAFTDAEYDKIIERNPTYRSKINATKASQSADDKYVDYDAFDKIRNYAVTRFELSYFVIYILCITGARFREAVKITTSDIDKENSTIFLNGTKTETSPRHVIVSPYDVDFILKRLSEYRGETPLDISNNAVTKSLRHIIDILGIDKKDVTLHMLRHTHCSTLIHDDMDIHYISKRLGHSSISTTLKTYSHLLDKKKNEEGRKIEELLAQKWHKNKNNPSKR